MGSMTAPEDISFLGPRESVNFRQFLSKHPLTREGNVVGTDNLTSPGTKCHGYLEYLLQLRSLGNQYPK